MSDKKAYGKAITAGVVLTLMGTVQPTLLIPYYAHSDAQTYLAPVNAIGSLLLAVPKFLAYRIAPPEYHHDTPLSRLAIIVIMFIIYTGAFCLLVFSRKLQAKRTEAHTISEYSESSDNEVSKTMLNRRQFLSQSTRNVIAGSIATAGCTAGAYGMLLEPRRISVTNRKVSLRDLPAELSGLRAVQLTDIHHGPWIPIDFVKRIVEITNALKPDLVLLTGDYISNNSAFINPVMEVLATLRPKIGMVGVLGNHDWWEGVTQVRERFAHYQIPLIDNTKLFLTTDKTLVAEPPSTGLCIAGVGDFWEDVVDLPAVLRGVPSDMPRLLLSHNPDVAEMPDVASGNFRIDLMLSGHTHGGQIRIPGFGTPIVPSNYGQKYAQGLVQGPGCPIYISRGVGMTVLPMRLGVPPEIALFELIKG